MENKKELLYLGKDGEIHLNTGLDSIWMTQQEMVTLFEKNINTINEHIQNIYKEDGLNETLTMKVFPKVVNNGKTYEVKHYNIDMVISVGFRVKSDVAKKFRQWVIKMVKSGL